MAFSRIDLPTDFVHDVYPGVHHPRKLASFPPSARLHLQVKLDNFIADGRSGSVFVINSPTSVLDSSGRCIQIPPLVCKFAAPDRNTCVAREAWFYDEMQTIQGMAIPRCFGLFEAEIPKGFEFIPHTVETYYEDRTPEERAAELLYERTGVGSFQDTPRNWEIRRRIKEPQRVVLLLLERLGGQFLPLYTKIPDEIRYAHLSAELHRPRSADCLHSEDAYAAYDVLAEAGFEHCDIRLGNLLCTLDSPLALPGIPSPIHNRVLKCRIIDFELSCKTAVSTDILKKEMHTPLYDLMYGLPAGDVLNQKLHYLY